MMGRDLRMRMLRRRLAVCHEAAAGAVILEGEPAGASFR